MLEQVKENLEHEIKEFKLKYGYVNLTGLMWEHILYNALKSSNYKFLSWNPGSHKPGTDMSWMFKNNNLNISCKSGLISSVGRKKEDKKFIYSFSSYRLTAHKNIEAKHQQILKINNEFNYYACIFRYKNENYKNKIKVCFIPSKLVDFNNIKFQQGNNKNSWKASSNLFSTEIKDLSSQLWITMNEDLINHEQVISFDIDVPAPIDAIRLIA